MIKNYLFLLFGLAPWSLFAQATDTCQYVHESNQIGGLDCAMGSLASFEADSYQWLNCSNNFEPFPEDTNAYYSGMTSISVALVMQYLGCIDTSECAYVCTWGIEEFIPNDKKLLRIVNLNGEETREQPNMLLIYIYSDGSRKKMFRIE